MREKLLSVREVAQILGISEKEVIELAQQDQIPHFKIAHEFLRFKKEEVLKVKKEIQRRFGVHREDYFSRKERIKEFLYFHDFYIISSILIIVLLWIIFMT